MNIGKQGLDLIKQFEGLRLEAYKCPAGVWTVGYGHTKTVKPGLVITEAEATNLLLKDLAWVEAAVNKCVTVPLSQPQYDALCSFTYNVGATALKRSTLVRLLNAGDYKGAEAQFSRWNKAGGKALKGLTRRREAERELFVSVANRSTPDASNDAHRDPFVSVGTPSVPSTTNDAVGGPIGALMALLATLLLLRRRK